ncbi:hypothetical protein M0813_12154 [Anaeramoeba flamelloides]|uniref:Uncharacterized protein n=1 Tax=Anaeramoeba flamelloides TaxID=1746091 RepID=A0ABQ8ZCD4_9EUKA|nr:hypothetical protein M0813_12154 [Anaeramoeba flamelloides]
MIALSCLFLAALNTENDVTGWFSELNISIEELKSISDKILKIHQQIEQSLNDKRRYEKNVTQILNKIKKQIIKPLPFSRFEKITKFHFKYSNLNLV